MIEIKRGDLVKALNSREVDAIIHQVNCHGVMGAGIAKQIKEEFPSVYEEYRDKINSDKYWGLYTLGDYQMCTVDNGLVVNMFSQNTYGRYGRHTNYAAMGCALTSFVHNAVDIGLPNITVGLPYMIGCGNGGGDWDVVKDIINDAQRIIDKSDIEFVFYRL